MNWFRRKIQGSGDRVQGTETSLPSDHEKQETVHGREIVSGCVFSSRYCRARGTSAGEIQEGSLQQIYKLPLIRSFLILLFKNDYAEGPRAYTYGKSNDRKFEIKRTGISRNKITDNGTSEDNVSCVNTNSGNRFKLVVIENNHRINNIIHRLGCQGMLSISEART